MGEASLAFQDLDRLLRPRAVAVIGASDDPTRIGGRPLAYMLAQGFAQGLPGALMPVNPNRATVQGVPAFASIAALPQAPDAAIVAIPGEAAVQAVADLGARGCGAAIVFTAGFAETGEAGAAMQARLLAAARPSGMRLLGPNCLGLFNATLGYFPIFSASFESGWPRPALPGMGGVGIASQSGAYGSHLFAAARDRGIATPVLVTTGNEADLGLSDIIGWMAESEEVQVIAAYAEGIQNGPRFIAALEAARAAKKPVVMMKVGRSALGRAAAQSHTASIAGDDRVMDAVLAEFGVHRARTTEELLDICYVAQRGIFPARNSLGVVTISGGAGVLMSDAAEAAGLPMPPMPEAAQAKLKELVPFSSPLNPVDCTAQAFNDMSVIGAFAESMVTDGGYASVIAFFTQWGASPSMAPRLRAELKKVLDAHPDRLFLLSILAPPERVREWEADGFLCMEDPSRAVVALAAMGRFGEAFAAAPTRATAVPAILLPAATPNEADAKHILSDAGIPMAPEAACLSAEDAVNAADAIGYPVVAKILSPDILHKSEIGGVLLNLSHPAAVREGFSTLMQRARAHAPGARIDGVLVAKQLTGGVEMALGVVRDPVFGPVAMVGLGGVFIEIFADVAFRRCPLDATQAEAMIRSLRGFPLLDGARGKPRADVAALAQALVALSRFAVGAGPRLASAEINPLLVLPAGEGAFAADAVLELSPET
ncbi:acetate--CoA ligase family protein [Falsiroseomonas selenitidurans]|uniref:Acetate--CoA ligase family protein n=1 Tax=Falsiroseomonas selenitidurans TaxID=2716335 RepID=A0ABX1ECX0_9PROT|nr:acetate--CoA ligase family protein [Falsiroseomonas selenitidurans]NKC33367.1 acetate--CoA ligase family protein [Falsiroseomonas selenitidurans]